MREKARQFANDLGVSQSDFDCSAGWLERFKVRHGIVFKRTCGESNSVNHSTEAMTDWNSRLSTILKDYNPNDIFNADETGLFYRLQPDKTLEFKPKDCHGGK
ncbi:tigger transposable element-derived protein 6-like [Mercenaria mercenaria]|uniref:tigger transposable element-derived protein 6-like n=1 Tax=Mercenaria mercenaria TaxID=6596 RepID=UPI00234FA503|nr:tigger transposable element-derived protein 6-like [Mercenaria mercenaria]